MSSARLECGCRRSKVSNVLMCVRKAETLCIDCNVEMYAGAATEVEALRKALGEAEEKAVQQQAARKKLKAQVKEVQQELQDAVKKCEALEHDA